MEKIRIPETRTQTVIIEAVLDELYMRLENDIESTLALSKTCEAAYNDTYEDGRACKYCLDVLRWCKLISDSECADMQEYVDYYIEEKLIEFKNRITENKED